MLEPFGLHFVPSSDYFDVNYLMIGGGRDTCRVLAFHIENEMAALLIEASSPNSVARTMISSLEQRFPELDVQVSYR